MTDTTVADANPSGSISVAEATSRLFDEAPSDEGQAEIEAPTEAEATNADADDEVDIDLILNPDSDDDDVEPDEDLDEAEARYQVTVQGEDIEVTLEEALAGFQRGKDYSIKTAELAKERRQLAQAQSEIEADKAQTAQLRQGMSQRLSELDSQISQTVQDPGPEYWNELYESDPMLYMRQREQFRDYKDQQTAMTAERQALAAEDQKEALRNHQRILTQENQVLVQRIPAWAKAEVRAREMPAVKAHLEAVGYTAAEIDTVVDSRAVRVAYDSWLLSQLRDQTAKAKSRTSKAPKMVTTSRVKSPQASQQKAEAGLRDRFKKSGSVSDALAILNSRS